MAPERKPLLHLVQLFWRIVLVGHGAVAAAWIWMMPGGFPVGHARFWANRALPALVIAVAFIGLLGAWLRKPALLRLAVVPFPAAWLAGAVTGAAIFPVSARRFLPFALMGAVVLGLMAFVWFWRRKWPLVPTVVAVVLGAAVGIAAPLTQRAGPPSTTPIDEPFPELDPRADQERLSPSIAVSDGVEVLPPEGLVRVGCGELRIELHPLLTFWSRSPDRCWTILAAPRLRQGLPRLLRGVHRDGDTLRLSYRGEERTLLDVSVEEVPRVVHIKASTELRQPVYSHVNAFCELSIAGHRKLALLFSPCPEARIEVRPADYPVGRPARVACLDAQGRFHVVEARSGEKGPFRELAAGELAPTEPLAITLCDEGQAVCRIVLDDWARQAGTALSPTAGWGLPVNAIEFSLRGDAPDSEATLFITLAGTSVGRGWDSVGHAAGIYRNRMRIEPVPRQALRASERESLDDGLEAEQGAGRSLP